MTADELVARIRFMKRKKHIKGTDLVVIAGAGDRPSGYAEGIAAPRVRLTDEARAASIRRRDGFYLIAFEEVIA